jgi:hypothetical protein
VRSICFPSRAERSFLSVPFRSETSLQLAPSGPPLLADPRCQPFLVLFIGSSRAHACGVWMVKPNGCIHDPTRTQFVLANKR